MSRELVARLGFISLSTSSFYGPVNFSGSSLVGVPANSVLFANASGVITGSSAFTYSPNTSMTVNTSTVASAGIARGVIFNHALTASANNDVLVGLDISPTYATNPYTGVTGYALRINNNGSVYFAANGNPFSAHTLSTSNELITFSNGNSGGRFNITHNVVSAQSKFSVGFAPGVSTALNHTLYVNGTVGINTSNVSSGYQLDVNGSGATAGALRVVSGSVFSGSVAITDNITLGTATTNPTVNFAASSNASPATFIINNPGFGGTLFTVRNSADTRYVRISGVNFDLVSSGTVSGGTLATGNITISGTTITGFNQALVDMNGDTMVIRNRDNTGATMTFLCGDGDILFQQRPASVVTTRAKFAQTTGNFIIQSGGTITDANYKVQITPSNATSGSLLISGSTTQPVVVGNSLTSVNIIPTMVFTTASQTQTAFKVMPTFSGSSAFTSSQSNIIADFGATSVGSQLIVTDVTSGSIYMVNDVSGIPIAEATSDWNFLLYDYPYTVFKKTGSMIELGVQNQASSYTLFKSDLIVNEGLGFYQRTSQVSGSTNGAVTSSLYNIQFTNTSASVYINAIVTGYDTGSRDTIAGDIKATIRYRSGVASIVGIDQSFVNSDNSAVGFDIIAGGTSGSLVAFGTGSRVYQWGATITTQVI